MFSKLSQRGFLAPLLCLICCIVFYSFPELDLAVTGIFYDPETAQFGLKKHPLFEAIYRLFAYIHFPLLLLLIIAGILIKTGKFTPKNYRKYAITFMLTTLIIGPGILVNTVLKDNSIGRARPVQVQEFGGDKQFTPAFVYSGECKKNCSFVSGHAAMGFYFIILGWLFSSARLFWTGFGIGILLSLTRIVQGGHFFSDTILAFWVVYFVIHIEAKLLGFKHPLSSE